MTNTKNTKRALLASVMALFLCFSMLLGTTFAWFTDSVTSGNNIIKSGNLDIELEYWNGTDWADVKDASDILTNTLWEPGVTEVAYLRIANAGSLVLKYQFGVNILNEIEGKNQKNETFKLSDYIMFGVVEGVNGETAAYAKTDAGRTAAIAAVTDAKKISAGYTKASTMNPNEELYLALVVYMPTNTDNVANHNGTDVPQIDLGINVLATQMTAENDNFGNGYDEAAKYVISSDEKMIFNGTEFDTLVSNNGTVDMTNAKIENDNTGFENYGDATLNGVTVNAGTPGTQAYGYAINAYAGSTTVLNDVVVNSANGAIGVTNGANLTFNSGSVDVDSESTSGRYLFYVEGAGSTLTINGGNFDFNKTQNQKRAYIYAGEGTTVYVNGGTFGKASSRNGYTAGLLGEGNIVITGGTFGFDPTKWVAEGCKAVKEGSVWTVKPVAVTTAEELAELLTSDAKNIAVTLANDIDLPISALGNITAGSGEYKLGGANTDNIIIDLNGNKLNITTTYWSAIGANNDNATITIKNGSMTSTGNSAGTWNAYDVRLCNCNYVIENVTFDKAVAIDNAGKATTMKNVTINATGDVYALWITAEGQNVTIDGLTINSEGRGIKIDEQYVAAPEKVILNVSNATFNTVKKAAVIVKSAAGADITLDNVNIDNVKGDFTNAVWNDADSAASFDKVTVNGGSVVQEQ